MSVSIFFLAVFVGIATAVISILVNYYDDEDHVLPTACAGIFLTLALLVASFSFENVKYVAACIKYDHVVVLDFERDGMSKPLHPIDPDKVIWQTDYHCNRPYTTVIMAWNDDKLECTYDKIVGK